MPNDRNCRSFSKTFSSSTKRVSLGAKKTTLGISLAHKHDILHSQPRRWMYAHTHFFSIWPFLWKNCGGENEIAVCHRYWGIVENGCMNCIRATGITPLLLWFGLLDFFPLCLFFLLFFLCTPVSHYLITPCVFKPVCLLHSLSSSCFHPASPLWSL